VHFQRIDAAENPSHVVQIRQRERVIGMKVSQEDVCQLTPRDAHLGQSNRAPAARVEQEPFAPCLDERLLKN
jgi:hypothetical protein